MKKYLFLDTNIWLEILNVNNSITEKIYKLLNDSNFIIFKNDILEMEIRRNKSKVLSRSKLNKKQINEAWNFILDKLKNNPSCYLKTKKYTKIINDVKWRDFANYPPHYSPEHEKIDPNNHNDSLIWMSILWFGKKYVDEGDSFDLYSNDRHFWSNKDYLQDEWSNYSKGKLNIYTFKQYEFYKILLEDKALAWRTYQSIFIDLNSMDLNTIDHSFIKYLINNAFVHPIWTMLDHNELVANNPVNQFFCELMFKINNDNKFRRKIIDEKVKNNFNKLNNYFKVKKIK